MPPIHHYYAARKLKGDGVQNIKRQLKRLDDLSFYYSTNIDRVEANFVQAIMLRPPVDMSMAILYEAQFLVPLMQFKDHADFCRGVLETMLPEDDKPYHPQEPELDRFAHIKNRFRVHGIPI